MEREYGCDVFEYASDLVDGRRRGIFVDGSQEREVIALQLQDDIDAVERIGGVGRCSWAK